MSGANYRRATKNHAVRVDHTDGSVTNGFVPVPMGMDFVGTMMQAQHFLHFETDDGELTLMNVAAIKRITSVEDVEANAREAQTKADKIRAEREAEDARKRAEEEAERKAEAEARARASGINWTAAEYDALEILGLKAKTTKDEISTAYRKLVKLYHPDRLRGLGVSQKKIAFAADRLAEINDAYRLLTSSEKAA